MIYKYIFTFQGLPFHSVDSVLLKTILICELSRFNPFTIFEIHLSHTHFSEDLTIVRHRGGGSGA